MRIFNQPDGDDHGIEWHVVLNDQETRAVSAIQAAAEELDAADVSVNLDGHGDELVDGPIGEVPNVAGIAHVTTDHSREDAIEAVTRWLEGTGAGSFDCEQGGEEGCWRLLFSVHNDPSSAAWTTGSLRVEVLSELPADEVVDRLAEQAASLVAAMAPDVVVKGVETDAG